MHYRKLSVIIFALMIFSLGCQSLKPHKTAIDIKAMDAIVSSIEPGESVAVSWVYNAMNGDITALGNIWRDRVSMMLRNHDIRVKERKDLVLLIDDMESFGDKKAETDIWKKAGADIVVTGTYRIQCNQGEPDRILLHVKASRVDGAELIGSSEWSEPLGADWVSMSTSNFGNVYHKKLQTITSPENIQKQPSLKAWLNSSNASYQAGEKGQIHIQTDPGAYLYLFNLAADNSLTLLYPNRYCKSLPAGAKEFVFPKDCSDAIGLEFYPLIPGKACRESVIVVASTDQFDFSFVPFQNEKVYHWVKGEDIKKVYQMFQKARGWKTVRLDYVVKPAGEN